MSAPDPPETLTTLGERVTTGRSRREFLRTAALAGGALGTARLLGVGDVLGADGTVTVTTALVRSDSEDPWSIEERTKTVPADWYQAVTKAFELNDLLSRTRVAGYLGSSVVPGDYHSGGASLTVQVTDSGFDRTVETLGELADGVTYEVEAIEGLEELKQGIEAEDLEPRLLESTVDGRVPGGIGCKAGTSLATLAPALYDPDERQRYFATAYHAFPDVEDPTGERLDLPLADGTRPNGGFVPDDVVRGPTDVRVYGQLTKWGLADLVTRGEPLEKVGTMTGHTTGEIQGLDAFTCLTDAFCRRGQLRWGDEADMTDGDSGSVSYYDDPELPEDGVLVAGFNNARTWWPGQDYVWGVAAYRLTDEHGYHF
ncbi:MAG: twin-arginine translocation signal domain-containing protein [Halanaeroarchaeum sp.]